MEYKIEGEPNLVKRDGIIVNKDVDGYQAYILQKKALEDRDVVVNELKDEIKQLKELVQILIQK